MNHELVTSWTEETIILIWWKGYSSTHDSWEDATEVRAPALMKEYYQRKFTAVWTIKIDQGVHSLATSTPPSALFTPIISISSITFMNDDAQQRSLIDPWTGNLLSPIITNVNMWWNDPSLWPMPNNSLNDNGGGGQTSYFPGFIPKIFNEIYPTSITPITTWPYEPDHAPAASSHIIQAAGAGPSIEIENLAISVDARQLRFTREAKQLSNGQFKPANWCTPGTVVLGSTLEPPKSAQPSQELSNDTTPSNSHPHQSRWLRTSAGDSLHLCKLSPASC